ncbi:MAG: hypothetical protein ACYTF7_03005 [Planctomycetota bacterium]|jgi:hypothetical protein
MSKPSLIAIVLLPVVIGAQSFRAQDQPAPEEESSEETVNPLPDLDDLLGLPSDDSTDDDDKEELERALTNQEISDQFKQAVSQMHDVATALTNDLDPGLRTQRTQEEILKKLDLLIEQAQQNAQSGSSSASQQQQRQQQQQQGQQQQTGAEQQASGSNPEQASTPQGGQDGDLSSLLEATQAAWGSLPPRVRDTLLQGSRDRFSSLYESLTESYYRRLAEENQDP